MISSVSARAQEALQTAVRGDRLYESRQGDRYETRGDEWRAGPVFLRAGLSYSLGWNDNILLVPTDTEDDFIHGPQVNFGIRWPATEDSTLNFGVGIGYAKYMEHSELDRMTVSPDSLFAWDIKIEDLVLSVTDAFQYSQDVISEGGLSGTAEYPRVENTAGLRARWYPSRYVLELGYAHYNFFSQGGDFDYLTRAEEQFFGRAGVRLAEVTQVGVEASGTLTDYDSETRPDNQNISLGPYVNWQMTDAIWLTARVGYTLYVAEASILTNNRDRYDSYYVGFDARHQLTDYITHGLAVSRDVQQSVNQGGLLTEQFSARYSASWLMTDNLSVNANVFFEHGKEPQFGFTEEYDRMGAGGGVSWQVTQHGSVSLAYQFTTKDSNLDSRDYSQNAVTFSASYQF